MRISLLAVFLFVIAVAVMGHRTKKSRQKFKYFENEKSF